MVPPFRWQQFEAQLVEITADKKVVGELFDYTRFGTISGFFVMDD